MMEGTLFDKAAVIQCGSEGIFANVYVPLEAGNLFEFILHEANFTGITIVKFSENYKVLPITAFPVSATEVVEVLIPNVAEIKDGAFASVINLKDIYYAGTEAEFVKAASCGLQDNIPLFNARVHLLGTYGNWYDFDWSAFKAIYKPSEVPRKVMITEQDAEALKGFGITF